MAEEFRHAGIGIDLDIQGVDKLTALNNVVDDSIKHISDMAKDIDFTTRMFDKFDGAKSKIDELNSSIRESSNKFNDMNNTNNRATGSLNNLIGSVNDVRSRLNQTNQDLDVFHNKMGNFNTAPMQNVNNIFNQNILVMKGATDDLNKFKDGLKELPTSGIDEEKKKMHQSGEGIDENRKKLHRLRDTALGTFAGNIISNGIQNITGGLKDAVSQGLQFDAATDNIKHGWQQLGLNDSQTNGMVSQIGEIRKHADISAGSIANLQKQYYTLTGSTQKAQALTSTVTSYGRASGMNEEQMSGVNRLISSNKNVNSRTFQRSLGKSPLFAQEIIKESGMTKNAFNDLLQSGKMTGQQLRDDMIRASKDSTIAWSDYAKTSAGKMDMFKSTVANTKKSFSMSLTTGMFGAIQKIVGNNKSLNNMQNTISKISTNMGKTVGNGIGKVISFLTKNAKPLSQIGSSIWSITKSLTSGAWNAIKGTLGVISGRSKDAHNGLNGISNILRSISSHKKGIQGVGAALIGMFAVSKIMKSVIFVGKFIKTLKELKMVTLAAKGAMTVMKAAQWGLNLAMNANPIGLIITGVVALGAGIYELYKHFKPFRTVVNGAFKTAISWGKKLVNFMKPMFKNIVKQAKTLWKDVTSIFKNAWNTAKDIFKAIGDIVTGNFSNLGKVVPKLIGDLWSLVKSLFKGAYDWINDETGGALDKIWDTFKSWGSSIGNFFKGLWDGIKKTTADSINGVTGIINDGIKGLNWILSKLGGSGHTIGEIPKVHFAQGTMDGRIPKNTMAMLNDGNDSPETGNKELVQLPNGKEFIPQKRNWVGMLPKGSRIFNATQTKMLMELRGIRHYAGGSTIWDKGISFVGGAAHKIASGVGHITHSAENMAGKAMNGIIHGAHGAWDWTKSTASHLWSGAKGIANAIAHPIKFLKSLFGGLTKMPEFFTDFGGGIMNKVKDMAISFFNKNSSASNPVGGDVKRWIPVIRKAGAFMHQSLDGSDIGALLNRIQKESGGNPGIRQQVQDVNSAAGNPARGLVQYTPTTFASWALPGHSNITNGFDQLLAVLNDSNWKSDIRMPGGWGPTGHHARKNGGPVKAKHWYQVNEEGQELFKPDTSGKVINHNDSKRIINQRNRPITVNAPLTVNIKGDTADKNIDKKIHERYEDHTRAMAEKLKDMFGEEGDYRII